MTFVIVHACSCNCEQIHYKFSKFTSSIYANNRNLFQRWGETVFMVICCCCCYCNEHGYFHYLVHLLCWSWIEMVGAMCNTMLFFLPFYQLQYWIKLSLCAWAAYMAFGVNYHSDEKYIYQMHWQNTTTNRWQITPFIFKHFFLVRSKRKNSFASYRISLSIEIDINKSIWQW